MLSFLGKKGDVNTRKEMYLNSELDRCCKALNGHRNQTTGPALVSLHLKAAAHVDAKYPVFLMLEQKINVRRESEEEDKPGATRSWLDAFS